MTYADINNSQRKTYVKDGSVERNFTVTRLEMLELLDSLRDQRVFYKMHRNVADMDNPHGRLQVTFPALLGEVSVEASE